MSRWLQSVKNVFNPKNVRWTFSSRNSDNLELVDNKFISEDPCISCTQPCNEHSTIPVNIASKVDQCKIMSNTVKPYQYHIILLIPSSIYPIQQWPSKPLSKSSMTLKELDKKESIMKDDPWSYLSVFISRLEFIVENASQDKNHTMVTVALNENEIKDDQSHSHISDNIPGFDILLLPRYQCISNITLNQLKESMIEDILKQYFHHEESFEIENTDTLHPSIILVCAHMQRDVRCGVIGQAILEEISNWKSNNESKLSNPIQSYACSHIGGHAFAGNLIIYPSGDWYGRITPCLVQQLLDAHILQKKIIKKHYRGSIGKSLEKSVIDF